MNLTSGNHQESRRWPTAREVAARAGVSVAAESRAINGVGSLNPDLKTRVLGAADEIAYRVDGLARMLRPQVKTVFDRRLGVTTHEAGASRAGLAIPTS